jgi:MFS family permease
LLDRYLVWPSVYVLAAAFAFQPFFFANTDAAVRAYWYAVTPDRLIGRVPSAMGNVMVLALPLGPLAAGFLIESASPHAAIALFLAVTLVAAVLGTLSKSTRDVPAPEETRRRWKLLPKWLVEALQVGRRYMHAFASARYSLTTQRSARMRAKGEAHEHRCEDV